MCGTTSELPLTDKNEDGCTCCAAPASKTAAGERTAETAQSETAKGPITLTVAGMTCGHCVSSVTEELTEVDGVKDVQINLVPNGASIVTVDADPGIDPARLRAAVAEAGYEVVDS